MDTAVLDKLGQGQAGNLPPDIIEGAHHDHARGVVDDDVDSRTFFESPDIAAFAAYYPPFHIVTGDVDGADGGVGGMSSTIALHGGYQYLLGLVLADGAQIFFAF